MNPPVAIVAEASPLDCPEQAESAAENSCFGWKNDLYLQMPLNNLAAPFITFILCDGQRHARA